MYKQGAGNDTHHDEQAEKSWADIDEDDDKTIDAFLASVENNDIPPTGPPKEPYVGPKGFQNRKPAAPAPVPPNRSSNAPNLSKSQPMQPKAPPVYAAPQGAAGYNQNGRNLDARSNYELPPPQRANGAETPIFLLHITARWMRDDQWYQAVLYSQTYQMPQNVYWQAIQLRTLYARLHIWKLSVNKSTDNLLPRHIMRSHCEDLGGGDTTRVWVQYYIYEVFKRLFFVCIMILGGLCPIQYCEKCNMGSVSPPHRHRDRTGLILSIPTSVYVDIGVSDGVIMFILDMRVTLLYTLCLVAKI